MLNLEKNINKSVNINGYRLLMMSALPMSLLNTSVVYITALVTIVKELKIICITERSGYLIVVCRITNI